MNNRFDGEMTIGKRAAAFGLGILVWIVFLVPSASADNVFSTSKAYFVYALGNSEPLKKIAAQEAAREMDGGVSNEAIKEMSRAEIANPGFQRRMVIYVVVAILVIAGALKLFGYI